MTLCLRWTAVQIKPSFSVLKSDFLENSYLQFVVMIAERKPRLLANQCPLPEAAALSSSAAE